MVFRLKTSGTEFAEHPGKRYHEQRAAVSAGAGIEKELAPRKRKLMPDPLPTWVIDVAVLVGLGLGVWLGDLLGSWYRRH